MSSLSKSGGVPAGKRTFLNCLNQFRGLAILFVVIGHCFYLSGTGRRHSFSDKFLENFFKNGTVYFVFIAGFLFHHIQSGRFKAGAYFRKRLPRLLTPFFFFSILALVLNREVLILPELFPQWVGSAVWARKLFTLLTGATFGAYWYIPMAVLLVALAPAVLWVVQRDRLMRWLLPLLCVVSLFGHRPPMPNFNTLHSLLYYLPVYLFGALCARDQVTVLPLCARHAGLWWGLGLAAVAAQTLGYEQGNFHKPLFTYAGLDVNLLGKFFLTLGILGNLYRLEARPFRLLDFLAEYSFPIYFLHSPLILQLERITGYIPFRGHLFMLPVLGIVMAFVTAGMAWMYFALIRRIRPVP